MLLAFVALLFCQRLDPSPRVCHPGETVVVRVLAASGEPQPGIPVTVVAPDGSRVPAGPADAQGEVRFEPRAVGRHRLRAEFPAGPLVIAVYDVVSRPRRWLYALLLTPLGVVLIWWNASKMRAKKS